MAGSLLFNLSRTNRTEMRLASVPTIDCSVTDRRWEMSRKLFWTTSNVWRLSLALFWWASRSLLAFCKSISLKIRPGSNSPIQIHNYSLNIGK
jgi:hypothetical protein